MAMEDCLRSVVLRRGYGRLEEERGEREAGRGNWDEGRGKTEKTQREIQQESRTEIREIERRLIGRRKKGTSGSRGRRRAGAEQDGGGVEQE